jgi:hypothetical protein
VYIKEVKLVMEKNLPKEKAPDTGHLTKNQNGPKNILQCPSVKLFLSPDPIT